MFNLICGALRVGLAGGLALGVAGVASPDTLLARSTLCLADSEPACRVSDLLQVGRSLVADRDSMTVAVDFASAVIDAGMIARSELEAATASTAILEVGQ